MFSFRTTTQVNSPSCEALATSSTSTTARDTAPISSPDAPVAFPSSFSLLHTTAIWRTFAGPCDQLLADVPGRYTTPLSVCKTAPGPPYHRDAFQCLSQGSCRTTPQLMSGESPVGRTHAELNRRCNTSCPLANFMRGCALALETNARGRHRRGTTSLLTQVAGNPPTRSDGSGAGMSRDIGPRSCSHGRDDRPRKLLALRDRQQERATRLEPREYRTVSGPPCRRGGSARKWYGLENVSTFKY